MKYKLLRKIRNEFNIHYSDIHKAFYIVNKKNILFTGFRNTSFDLKLFIKQYYNI